jgi:hypothetical protein
VGDQTQAEPNPGDPGSRHLGVLPTLLVVAGLFVGATVIVVIVAFAVVGCGSHTSDSHMIDFFHEHEQQFGDLLQMFQSDSRLDHAGDPLSGWPSNATSLGMPQTRVARYDALLKELKVQLIERVPATVVFTVSTVGLVSSGSAKGYVYSSQALPSVSDTQRSAEGPGGEVYRHIVGGWYLFYYWEA